MEIHTIGISDGYRIFDKKLDIPQGGVRKKSREGMVGWVGVKIREKRKFPLSKNIFSTMKNHLKCAKLTEFLHLLE